MTVKELIFTHDMKKILDACCDRLPDNVDSQKWRKGLRKYLLSLKTVEPIYSKGVVLPRKYIDDDGTPYWEASAIVDFDPIKLAQSYQNVQDYKSHIEDAYVLFKTNYEKWNELFYCPLFYAMEFTPAAEVLGHQTTLRGIETSEVYQAIASIIDEMTFFGFEEQTKTDKLDLVKETEQQVLEILQKPQEEQEKYFFSVADLFPDMEYKEPTEEEMEETRQKLVQDCFASIEHLYTIFCAIKWRTCETLYIEE